MRLALSLALGLLVAPQLAAADKPKGGEEKLELGQTAPSFTLKTMNPKLSGTRLFPLRKFVGPTAKTPKTIVLSFAASYCIPCKKELAELKPLAGKLAAHGVQLAVVVVDTDKEGIEEMRALTVDELALTYPVLSDRFGVLRRRYAASALPKTVIVSPDGKVKWVSTGFKKGAIDHLLKALGV